MSIETTTIGLNHELVIFYPQYDEYVCEGCACLVDGPTGHDYFDCEDAARIRHEDSLAERE